MYTARACGGVYTEGCVREIACVDGAEEGATGNERGASWREEVSGGGVVVYRDGGGRSKVYKGGHFPARREVDGCLAGVHRDRPFPA